MAYIGKVSIRDNSHMENAIGYISREEKALSIKEFKEALSERLNHLQEVNADFGERMTCINCSANNTYKDFENMRKAFGQDKGVIAHHYYQSFSKDDNLSPELAHQIGTELAKRIFPDFQVVVSTHTDREHIHNHIIVNSCNMLTGQKWYSNKKSLSDIRRESDKLCLQYGLNVIDKNSKYKGIDRTTYQLGIKGRSWKIKLVKDLSDAVECCRSKEEFIQFLNKRDYSVRYKDVHITITKNGEKKGIRVDTLAKQFGEKFTKVNLEKKMGYYIPKPEISESKAYQKRNKTKSKEKSNWEHFEQWTFKQKNYYPSVKGNIKRYSRTDYLIKSAQRSVFYSRNTFDFIIRAFLLILAGKNKKRKAVSYHKVGTLPINKSVRNVKCIGNINYKTLTQSSGDNFTVKVNIENILKIVNQPILYSARIKNDTVEITVKEKDKDFLSELLELDKIKHQLEIQNEKITNQKAYKDLKREADITGKKLQYIIITAEQLKILKDNYIKFAYFEKDDKYNIAFLPTQTEVIKKLIFSKSNSEENEAKRNNRIYSQLKAAAAQSGEKLKYKTKLSALQLSLLKNSKIKFAYFACKENKELFNIAFERKDEEKIKSIIPNETLKKS